MVLKELTVVEGPVQIKIPYFELSGKDDGPSLFISGGLHGDEVNGVQAVREVISWISKRDLEKELKGKLYIFPVMNPTGFTKSSRFVPEDGKDLNRQFGKNQALSISTRIASVLEKEVLSKCSMGVDFHDAGEGAVLLPHARIHKTDLDNCVSCSRSLARVFGTEYVLERNGHPNMMAVALNNLKNIPVITVEMGGSRRFSPETTSTVVTGINNILVANHMIEGDLKLPKFQYVVFKRYGVQAAATSIVELRVALGDIVKKGDHVADVYDPITMRQDRINAVTDGVIFSVWPSNQIKKGRMIYTVLDLEGNGDSECFEVMENYQVSQLKV